MKFSGISSLWLIVSFNDVDQWLQMRILVDTTVLLVSTIGNMVLFVEKAYIHLLCISPNEKSKQRKSCTHLPNWVHNKSNVPNYTSSLVLMHTAH